MYFVLRTCPVNYLQMVDDVICDYTSHHLDASFQKKGIHTYMYVLIFFEYFSPKCNPCTILCNSMSLPLPSRSLSVCCGQKLVTLKS